MSYLFVHKRVRNDDHCPSCKRYFVTIYNDAKEIYEMCDLYGDKLDELMESSTVWIDEWVRRGNGDRHTIVPIYTGREYDIALAHNIRPKPSAPDENVKYMLLHITVDHKKWCPDNITFHATFYKTMDDLKEDQVDHLNIEKFNEQTLWIPKSERDIKNGDFYQIIEIKPTETIDINSLCEEIQENKYWA